MAFTPIRHYRTPRDLPPLTAEQLETIVGCILGDFNIKKESPTKNACLRFAQGSANSEYLMHLYSLFQSHCGTAPKVYTRPTGKAYISFQTLCSPMFNEYRDLFYSNGVKIVPPTIGELLTARGLAYFLQFCPP
jgi:hypothetical protein